MIRYKRGHDGASVVVVECPTPGWPNHDADGDTQYENSHFDTEAEAWECVLANARAGVSLALSSLENAEAVLAKTKEEVVYMTRRRHTAEENYELWQPSPSASLAPADGGGRRVEEDMKPNED